MHVDWQKVSIVINGTRYPSQVEAQLRYHINGSYLKQYLQKKQGWTDKVWQTIDMHAFGRHFKNLSPAQKVHQMKLVYSILPVSTHKGMISKNPDSEVAICPCCRVEEETISHLLLHYQANSERDKAIV